MTVTAPISFLTKHGYQISFLPTVFICQVVARVCARELYKNRRENYFRRYISSLKICYALKEDWLLTVLILEKQRVTDHAFDRTEEVPMNA